MIWRSIIRADRRRHPCRALQAAQPACVRIVDQALIAAPLARAVDCGPHAKVSRQAGAVLR